eukprot:2471601-Rhodomonas_salina.1
MSGTDIPYGGISLRACDAMPGTDIPSGGVSSRACYAMPGTDIPNGGISLRACYAMSVTDAAYAATRTSSKRQRKNSAEKTLRSISLRACHAMSRTDNACGASGLCACEALHVRGTARHSYTSLPPSLSSLLSPSLPPSAGGKAAGNT